MNPKHPPGPPMTLGNMRELVLCLSPHLSSDRADFAYLVGKSERDRSSPRLISERNKSCCIWCKHTHQ